MIFWYSPPKKSPCHPTKKPTLPETNSKRLAKAPENRPDPKSKLVTSLPTIHFQVLCLLVSGGVPIRFPTQTPPSHPSTPTAPSVVRSPKTVSRRPSAVQEKRVLRTNVSAMPGVPWWRRDSHRSQVVVEDVRTLPKTHMKPKNWVFVDGSPLPRGDCPVPAVSFYPPENQHG